MEPKAAFEEHATHVRCVFGGPFEFHALLELTGDIRAYCAAHGQRRVLVGLTESRGSLGPIQRYEHAGLIAQP